MPRKFLCFLMLAVLAIGPLACGSKNNPAAPSGPPTFSYDISFGSSSMLSPNGICVTGSDIWVANEYIIGSSVQEWTQGGSLVTTVGSYNSTSFNFPRDIAVGPDGYLYVADGSKLIIELDSTGGYVTTFAQTELGTDDTDSVAVNSSTAYVLDDSTPSVLAYTLSGTGASKTFAASATFGTDTLGSVPLGLALDGSGNIYVADHANDRVVKFNSAGVSQLSVTLVSSGAPTDVAVDSHGYIYASDGANNEVQMFKSTGEAVTQFGSADLSSAHGIALDGSGNLYVTDFSANQVVVFKKN